jgi:NDP-mannose synthase
MQAIVLAGGRGTRLLPYTTVLPKPLMPIGEYPILEIILRQLKAARATRVVLAVGYLSHLFEALFQDGSRHGLPISYSLEKEALGTAGPLAALLDEADPDFLVLNGDLLTTLNYRSLFEYHKRMNAAATIGVFTRKVNIDFGVLEIGENNELLNYLEKPTHSFDVSMGINAFNASAVRPYLKAGVRLDIPALMTQLRQDGHRVCCYREDCRWLDIGRPDDYQTALETFSAHQHEFLPSDPEP